MSEDRFAQAAVRLAHFASALLGWRPNDFWEATPAELALAISPPGDGAEALDRALVEALMERFPDEQGQSGNG